MQRVSPSLSLSADEFLKRLRMSDFLSPEDIDRFARADTGLMQDCSSLATTLVKKGLLTPFQIDALCDGTYTELRLGNYDLLDKLGAGGMGAVFKARHRRMKRVVAIKILPGSLAGDASFLQRFQREVETIARLVHPNIVMAYDADESQSGPFLAMEFVDGRDLASLVQKEQSLPVATAVGYTLQAARGLEYAHSQGIIHRDIKPANLLCDGVGTVKIADLGLARFNDLAGDGAATAAGGLTQTGHMLGTVDYMPPEQAIDAAGIDFRADIYSLGATLYFLLVGRPPYKGKSAMGVLLQHREGRIPSLTESRPDVPDKLDDICRRMMAKAPFERIQTMTEVVKALEAFLATSADSSFQHPPKIGNTAETCAGVSSLLATSAEEKGLAPPLSWKVLLVEPSRTQSGIIRKYLQSQGIADSVAVASGKEALQAVQGTEFDAILSALHLPDMTGVQLAEQVRVFSTGAATGFVLISSQGEAGQVGTLSNCGKATLLHKPFTPQQLLETLRLVIGGPAAQLAAMRVLIVDDSTPARMHVRNVLQEIGLSKFEEAVDGAQAVAVLSRQSFDLVVTDYNMPFMDGRGLVGYLKQNPATASIPVIMVTTEQDPAKLEAVRALGVTVCAKSFPVEVVRKFLNQFVKSS
jgi:serine/threonine-protein kinase